MYWILLLFLFLPMHILSLNHRMARNFGVLLLLLLFLFLSLNNGNNDYTAYLGIFEYPRAYAEIGYVYLVEAIKLINGSHSTLVFIVGLLWFVTYLRIIFVWKSNVTVFIIGYFIYPFLFDITQIRNTIMFLFILNACIALAQEKKKLAILLGLMSSLFHNFGLFYLIMLMFYIFGIKKSHKIWAIALLVTILMPFILSYLAPLIPFERIRGGIISYFSPELKFQSILIWGGDYIIFMLIAARILKYLKQSSYADNERIKNLFVLYNFLAIHALFLVFVVYFFEFNRVYRNAFILRFIFLSACIPLLNYRAKIFVSLYIFLNAIIFSFLSSLSLDGDYTYDQILTSNIIIDFFKGVL